jgi:hypothetical protein
MNRNKQEELIIEQIADGSNVKRKWLGFTNSEILYPIAGALGSSCVIVLYNFGMPLGILLPIFPIPFILSLIILFIFVYHKPPHYASDLVDGLIYGNNYLASENKFSFAPDGMFGENILIWGDWGDGAWACALELLVPPFDYARNEEKNMYKRRLDMLINYFAKEDLRIQLYWTVSDSYPELEQYNAATEMLDHNSICYHYRKERYEKYSEQLFNRRLRRERLVLFISSELSDKLSNNLSSATYDEAEIELHKAIKNHARRQLDRATGFLDTIGVGSRQLTTPELCSILRKYFNPSYNYMSDISDIVLDRSIKDNCILSDVTLSEDFSFVIDNHHACVFVLQAPLPKQLYPGIVNELTKRDILDYSITVNIIPRDLNKAINEEDEALKVLDNQISEKNSPASLQYTRHNRMEMLGELSDGRSFPVDCQIIIVAYAAGNDDMQVKSTAIKASLNRLGIGYYLLNESKGAINAYFQATPGWLYGKRPKHSFRTLDKYASCLLPFSSTYTGGLSFAEAIYNGEGNNLIGLKQFAGEINKDSDPQHAIVFGKTGAGKSVLVADLLMQTHDFYDYTCIIDYGLSYQDFAAALGHKPIKLGPSSGVTINYFDTNNLPLSGEHLSLVATVLRVMCNELTSEGMIMRYLKPFYLTHAAEWLDNNPAELKMLASIAILQEKYLSERFADDETEAYKLAKENWRSAGFDDETISRYIYSPAGRERVYMQCFAFLRRDDFPTHSLFVDYLRSKPLKEEDPKRLQDVADALEMWCAGGKNGRLFDGVSNLHLSGNFAYFELSGVPANDPNFKFVTGAVIQMVAMSKIERLPRTHKKRLIIDEANSFFEIPQGAKVIEAAMTKYRKHRCAVLVAFQQYEMLNNKDIKESVISNIHQYILLGQSDQHDVNAIGDALGLSDAIKEAVLNFETPANLPENDRYSGFAQITKRGGLTAGIGRNYLTPKMMKMISNQPQIQKEKVKK